jgi:hypothetical protein
LVLENVAIEGIIVRVEGCIFVYLFVLVLGIFPTYWGSIIVLQGLYRIVFVIAVDV